jgi:Domain of unknown function (DUF4263)
MKRSAEQVLAEIISIGTSEDPSQFKKGVLSPGYQSLLSLASLLASDPPEELLQQHLQANPQYLMGLFGSNDDGDLAFFSKPPVANRYVADFAVMQYGQGGAGLQLIEIESSSAKLFTKKGTPAKRLQAALGQIDDWRQWIVVNEATFLRDMLQRARDLPLFQGWGLSGSSVRFKEPDVLERRFREFGGFDYPIIGYSIIVGRWANLSEEHRKRLLYTNREHGNSQTIYTFDQLARQALVRPDLSFF